MDFRHALLVIFAFAFLAPGLSYAFVCGSGSLATTCIVTSSQTVTGVWSGAGNLIINNGVTVTVTGGSSLTVNMGGAVSLLGAISGNGIAAGSCVVGGNGAGISLSASSITFTGSITSTGGTGAYSCTGAVGAYATNGGTGGAVSISADKVIFAGTVTSNGGTGGTGCTGDYRCTGGAGGSGGTVSVSAGSTVFTGTSTVSGGSGGAGGYNNQNGGAGAAGSTTVTYGQFYSGSGAYSPKMRLTLTLKDDANAALSGVPLTIYQEGTGTVKCSGNTGSGTGILTCDIQTASPTNLDIYATGGGPKSAKLTIKIFNSSDNIVYTYLGASGARRIADLRLFAINLKDFSGAGIDGGKLTVKDQNGSVICTPLTIDYSPLDGDAYCRVAGASYPAAGKSKLYYGLSLSTNGAYQNDPVTFNDYLPRDNVIYIGSGDKYLPKHTSVQFVEKTPIEMRYFPSATSQDFIFNDTIPAGFSFSGAVSIIKHTSSGAQSCAYTPSGSKFSISSAQCAMLASSITPGGWFELLYNTTAPSVPPNTTQGYTIPGGYISYLS